MPATILVVDDNRLNLKLASLVIAAEGHTPLLAADAREALAILAQQIPDLILMDLQMPDIDGLELTRVIKSDPRIRGVRIVAVTAAAMHADRDRAAEAGCAGFITKPIDTRTFGAEIAPFLPAGTAGTEAA